MEALIFYWPAYRLAGAIKLITAIVSWATVIALVFVAPKALAMRSPEELEREVDARRAAEAALQKSNDELEKRIEERTAELIRANTELRIERERFQTTLSSIGDAVIATDDHGQITFINPVAKQLTRWGDEAIGKPLIDVFRIVNEMTGESVVSPVDKVLREGQIVGLANHTVLIAKDGSRLSIDDSGAPIRERDELIVGVVLVFRDVSERRQSEQRLEAARERMQTLADGVPALIAYIDADARYQLNNRAYETWFGRPRAELPGRHMRELLGETAWAGIQPHVAAVLSGRDVAYEAMIPYRDGGPRWISATYTPDIGKDGIVHGFVAHVTDITARKRVEEALRDADQRKDEFLALLAHELRNPLAPLRNGLQIISLGRNDPCAVESARVMMERQLAHLVHLVDDLLDVSRISRGKIELRKQHVELGEVVQSAIEMCDSLIKERGHEVSVNLSARSAVVYADPTRLAQVICNLLTNSAKYTDQRGRITISATEHHGQAVITVRDNGVGIPPDILPKVFDIFMQVDRSLEKAQGGLGIGLTIVKRLVELHGGTVEARSDGAYKGSEFTIRIPVVAAAATTTDQLATPIRSDGERVRRKVLVADDNLDSAESLSKMLTLLGNDVRSAHDGAEAVKAAEEFRPDLILMDVGMPRLNGFDATRRIREQPWGRLITIVALTGWGQDEDKRRSKEAGCNGHLVKPLEPATLHRLLADLPLAQPV